MKNKKILVGFALIAASGAAAVSSTFAWFTTNRSASIVFKDATIRNRSANLNVSYVSSFNSMIVSEGVDSFGDPKIDLTIDRSVEEAQYVTDISGNGLEFYKIGWSAIKNENTDRLDGVSSKKAGEIHEVTPRLPETIDQDDEGLSADGFLIDFTLKVSRDNIATDHGLLVYLGQDTRITPRVEKLSDFNDTVVLNPETNEDEVVETAHQKYLKQQMKNVNAAKAARLAVNDPINKENIFIYAQDAEDETLMPQYMFLDQDKPLEPSRAAYGLDGFGLNELNEVRSGSVHELTDINDKKGQVVTVVAEDGDPAHNFDFVSGFKSYLNLSQVEEVVVDNDGNDLPAWEQPYNYGLIADLSTGNATEAFVNFRMWIEGTDTDAINNVVGGVFNLELDIYTIEILK